MDSRIQDTECKYRVECSYYNEPDCCAPYYPCHSVERAKQEEAIREALDYARKMDGSHSHCRSCMYWNGEPDDKKPQFCDLKEDYTGPGGWCVRYSRRDG